MIVIPMAGLSRRFMEAGYDRPKYMLPVGDKSLFRTTVESFSHYFGLLPFVFVYRDIAGTDAFVRAEAEAMGIADARFVYLDAPTDGQAETVALGLAGAKADPARPLTIFNIDTIRPNFRFPPESEEAACAGYLEVFHGDGVAWSFVLPDPDTPDRVLRTTEKDRISDLCSTGLYHFARAEYFLDAYTQARAQRDMTRDEYFVAPLYNRLIGRGLDIRYVIIRPEEVVFSGVPSEYEDLCRAKGAR